MNTYTFKINAVDVHTQVGELPKVIYNVHWSYFAEDAEGNQASMIGVQSVSEPDHENFKPFEELREADVISWIEPLMDLEQMQSNLDAQISEKVAPTKQTLYLLSDDEVDVAVYPETEEAAEGEVE
jgi:hypothetical protein